MIWNVLEWSSSFFTIDLFSISVGDCDTGNLIEQGYFLFSCLVYLLLSEVENKHLEHVYNTILY